MMSARDSSSSEEENTERIKEALWNFKPETRDTRKDGGTHTQSKRFRVCEHEHDGNELQTTPEFRSHVAKKLGVMLDSVICEVFTETPAACEHTQDEDEDEDDDDDDDDGFRLFTTSLPGNWREEPKEEPPPKRRPAPSSSDSDSEMESRLREAAVSVSDLLRFSSTERRQEEKRTAAGAREEKRTDAGAREEKRTDAGAREEQRTDAGAREEQRTDAGARDEVNAEQKKKKKKRKVVMEREEDETSAQEHGSEKKKKKKKKKKRRNVKE